MKVKTLIKKLSRFNENADVYVDRIGTHISSIEKDVMWDDTVIIYID